MVRHMSAKTSELQNAAKPRTSMWTFANGTVLAQRHSHHASDGRKGRNYTEFGTVGYVAHKPELECAPSATSQGDNASAGRWAGDIYQVLPYEHT